MFAREPSLDGTALKPNLDPGSYEGPAKPEGIYTTSIDNVLAQFPPVTSPEGQKPEIRILLHYFAWPDSIPLYDFNLFDVLTWQSNLRKQEPTPFQNNKPGTTKVSGFMGALIASGQMIASAGSDNTSTNKYQFTDAEQAIANKQDSDRNSAIEKAENVLKEMLSRALTGLIIGKALAKRGYAVEFVNAAAGTAGDKTKPTDSIRTIFDQFQARYGEPEVKLVDIPAGWNTLEEMKAGLYNQTDLAGFIPISSDYHMARIQLYYSMVGRDLNKLDENTKIVFVGNPLVKGNIVENWQTFLGSQETTLDPVIQNILADAVLPKEVEAAERARDKKLFYAAVLGDNLLLDTLTVKSRISEGQDMSIRSAFSQALERRELDNTIANIQTSAEYRKNQQLKSDRIKALTARLFEGTSSIAQPEYGEEYLRSLIEGTDNYDTNNYQETLTAFARIKVVLESLESTFGSEKWSDDSLEIKWRDEARKRLLAIMADLIGKHYLKWSTEELTAVRPDLLPIINRLKEVNHQYSRPTDDPREASFTGEERKALYNQILRLHTVPIPYYVDIFNVWAYLELMDLREA